MSTASPSAPIVVILVSTKARLQAQDRRKAAEEANAAAAEANPDDGAREFKVAADFVWVRRWLHPSREAEALQDMAEGETNGVEKKLQRFTEAQIDRLPLKYRASARAAAQL